MKNKYQKLHRIVIGRSGSGKSFNILSSIKEDKKEKRVCIQLNLKIFIMIKFGVEEI